VQLQLPVQLLRHPSRQLDPHLIGCQRFFPSLCGAI
jgi:hypothetical protein